LRRVVLYVKKVFGISALLVWPETASKNRKISDNHSLKSLFVAKFSFMMIKRKALGIFGNGSLFLMPIEKIDGSFCPYYCFPVDYSSFRQAFSLYTLKKIFSFENSQEIKMKN
jgi:hypothetical protein